MNNYRIFPITLWGLCISQIIATIYMVYCNQQMATRISCLKESGYLIVPNIHVLPELSSLQTAFIGGLFFTGTIGLGMIGLALLLSWHWTQKQSKNKYAVRFLLILWVIVILAVSYNGWNLLSWYTLLLMPALIFFCLKNQKKTLHHPIFFWCLPIVFLIIVFFVENRSVSFVSIRDHLLLSNSIGQKLNDWYYQYTLYPGEVIKPLSLKQQKICYIDSDPFTQKKKLDAIKQKCIFYDYLVVPDRDMADIVIEINSSDISLFSGNRRVIQTDIDQFLRTPKKIFADFSKQTDNNEFFRMCILLSLILAAPILSYIITMKVSFLVLRFLYIPDNFCQWLTPCIVFTLICMIIFQLPHKTEVKSSKNWQQKFQSAYDQHDWRTATTLLKEKDLIHTETIDKLALNWLNETEHPVLKYWLIRFLVDVSEARVLFVRCLNDPQLNVVCQALYALGHQGDRALISTIRERIQTSTHWYIQMYAYRALKRLGWRNNN